MEEPKALTILWIVEDTRKMGSLKRLLSPKRGSPVSPLVPMIPMIDEERKKEKGMARVA